MNLAEDKQEKIAHAVIKVLVSRFSSFPENDSENRNAPFHEAFLNAFREKLDGRVSNIPDLISLSSWMHGLNTSLGQSFFESVAHILCDGEKRTFNDNQIYSGQETVISEIMNELKNGVTSPSFGDEDQKIATSRSGNIIRGQNFTADCYYETNDEIVAIEMKSVRPNSGEMKGEKEKILKAKAALRNAEGNQNKTIRYYMAFPFDPTSEDATSYDKDRFFNHLIEAKKFIDQNEMKIADEFWSFLSGEEETMNDILTIINDIATPEFKNNFDFINLHTSCDCNDNISLLRTWHLFSEIEIINRRNLFTRARDIRKMHLSVFKEDGTYNTRRLELL